MYVESEKLSNFRCFGRDERHIIFQDGLTTFFGSNGSGKTAVMQALMRIFGIAGEQRNVRLQD